MARKSRSPVSCGQVQWRQGWPLCRPPCTRAPPARAAPQSAPHQPGSARAGAGGGRRPLQGRRGGIPGGGACPRAPVGLARGGAEGQPAGCALHRPPDAGPLASCPRVLKHTWRYVRLSIYLSVHLSRDLFNGIGSGRGEGWTGTSEIHRRDLSPQGSLSLAPEAFHPVGGGPPAQRWVGSFPRSRDCRCAVGLPSPAKLTQH